MFIVLTKEEYDNLVPKEELLEHERKIKEMEDALDWCYEEITDGGCSHRSCCEDCPIGKEENEHRDIICGRKGKGDYSE